MPAASLSVCWKRERGRKEVLLCCLTPPDLHREGAVGLSGAARQEKRAGGREGSSSPPVRQQPRDTGGDRAAPAVTIGQNSDNISHHPLPTHPLITKLSTTFLSQLSLLAAPSWPGSLAASVTQLTSQTDDRQVTVRGTTFVKNSNWTEREDGTNYIYSLSKTSKLDNVEIYDIRDTMFKLTYYGVSFHKITVTSKARQ